MSSRPRRKRGAGREAKRAARQQSTAEVAAWIDRKIPYFEVIDEEALELIEHNADTVLEEIGIEFREFPSALELWREAGADVDGERVRFPRGLCRSIIQASAPREFTQHARNPARSVRIGGDRTVLVPAYGSPFVRDLDQGRRYAKLEDFHNFVKLAYMSPGLHHSGGTVCEPVDLPVNKRHFDMVYSHIKYSDKPFMGSVTHPERARDTIEMAKLVFGAEFVEQNTVITSLINANFFSRARCRRSPSRARSRRSSRKRLPVWPTCSSYGRVHRWSSARSPRPYPCSRGHRPSARPNRA
jgi:trimethylamine--corrinoid protein Co-methyltransferase